MFSKLKNIWRKNNRKKLASIDPDEIFLDSQNLPDFDTHQFEGRLEKPIPYSIYSFVSYFIIIVGLIFLYRLWGLQVVEGQNFRIRSDNNNLHNTLVFADRGVIFDRNKVPLVWNSINPAGPEFSLRQYATSTGLSTTLGYVKYPSKDSSGFYYQDKFVPKDGMEKIFNDLLSGKDGLRIVETDVRGKIISESVVQSPVDGNNLDLSIDLNLQRKLNSSIIEIANRAGYKGGAGVIMDINSGEILASSNYPEYDSQILSLGSNTEKINEWVKSSNHPFLNRVIDGLYTPGSIMKVFIAMGVLDQKVIDPRTQILSTGSIVVPNPFFPDKPSTFVDWKAHGLVDLRRALAVSSNVYFYEVGGGFKGQKGIGINNIEKYSRLFGFGTTTGVDFPGENAGTIPSPEWKLKTFNGEAWRVGDTYNTSIGQYGFQVSPIQVVRAFAGIASEGTLVTPTFMKLMDVNSVKKEKVELDLDKNYYKIVKEGMRMCVTEGTCQAINFPFVEVASKTGTAQIGVLKDETNSWVVGFWPYKNPKYAFAVVMERGPKKNQFGAVLVMQEFFNWVSVYASEYLK
ncbi:MAG: penicillin-binding protein 2 [Parcubacteria bacterium C7867-003]|nr:MAG: penicillin-binding protein 2 [Parcubacteria bacterium C7867-003]